MQEDNDLFHEMIESGDINLKNSTSKVALIYDQMNELSGARVWATLTMLTVAEYFRDQEGQDVFLLIDTIFCFTQAGSEVLALLAEALLQWVISLPWPLTQVSRRKEQPPPKRDLSHL